MQMDTIQSYNFLLCVQDNFNKQICDTLFGDLSNHIYYKWLDSEYNILNFLSKLDDNNKDTLLKWGESFYKDTLTYNNQ